MFTFENKIIKSSRILIVDDVLENIKILGNMLKNEGYSNIIPATNGKQALNISYAKKPELILLDIQMPEMDGYAVCHELKNNDITKDIPIIFLTAKTEIEDIVKGFDSGGVDYITKPFKLQELLARINLHLRLSYLMKLIESQKKELSVANKLLEQNNKILAEKSIRDSLTNIYNHQFIYDTAKLEFEAAIRYQYSLSIMMVDIDFFKIVNDTWGHPVGDEVLILCSRIIELNLRKSDIFGRYGGEEFLIILPSTDIESATQVAERIRMNIEKESFTVHKLKITISIGVTALHNNEINKFINRADKLLYLAKNKGRNCVVNDFSAANLSNL